MCRSPRRSSTRDELRRDEAGRQLAAVLAQLGLGVGEAEALVDRLLGRAAQRLAGLVVEDPVLADVQPAPHGRLAQRDVVRRRAGEVLQQVAEVLRRDDAQVDRQAGVRAPARGVLVGRRRRLDEVELAERAHQRAGVARRRDDVEVLDGVGLAARRAGELDALGGGVLAQRGDDLLADRQGAVQQHALGRAARRCRRPARRASRPRTSARSP